MRARSAREIVIDNGTRVRLKPDAVAANRPHLQLHARQRDVGVVSGPSRQSPDMSRLYTIVHFERCGHDHRLIANELEIVK